MKNVALLFLASAFVMAESGFLMGKLNPNFKLGGNKGSEVVGSAPGRISNLLQISRRDSTAQNREQCDRCKTTKLCSRNIDLCPICKSICDSLPALPTEPTEPTEPTLSSRFGGEFRSEANNRYLTVGAIEPGPTLDFLGRLFEIPAAQLAQFARFVVLAQPKIAEPSSRPLIFDSARALGANRSSPIVFGLDDAKRARAELAQEVNRELDRAIQNKRVLLKHDNFTRPEFEKIIDEVMAKINARNEDEVACKLDDTGVVLPVLPAMPGNYEMERKPEAGSDSGRLNPPIRQDQFVVGTPEENRFTPQGIEQRLADFPETLTVSEDERRSRPESDNQLGGLMDQQQQRLKEMRREFESAVANNQNDIAKKILKVVDNGINNLPARELTGPREPQQSNGDFAKRIVDVVNDGLAVPSGQNFGIMRNDPMSRNDLEDEVAKIVEDSLKVPETDPNSNLVAITEPTETVFKLHSDNLPNRFPNLPSEKMTPHEINKALPNTFNGVVGEQFQENEDPDVVSITEPVFRLHSDNLPNRFPNLPSITMTPHEINKVLPNTFKNGVVGERLQENEDPDVVSITEPVFRLHSDNLPNRFPNLPSEKMTPHEINKALPNTFNGVVGEQFQENEDPDVVSITEPVFRLHSDNLPNRFPNLPSITMTPHEINKVLPNTFKNRVVGEQFQENEDPDVVSITEPVFRLHSDNLPNKFPNLPSITMTPHEINKALPNTFKNGVVGEQFQENEDPDVVSITEPVFRLHSDNLPNRFPNLPSEKMTPHQINKALPNTFNGVVGERLQEIEEDDLNTMAVTQPSGVTFHMHTDHLPNEFPIMYAEKLTPHEIFRGKPKGIVGESLEQNPDSVGSLGSLVPLNSESNDNLPYKKVRFLGKDINLPLKMFKDENGGYQLRVDVDEFCNCKNSTCTRPHIDDHDNNLLEESVSNTILPELQVRYNDEVAQSKVAKRSLKDNKIDKENKTNETKDEVITPVKDIMKFYNVEKILEEKLHELDNDVKVFMEENENLLNKGTLALMRHFQTEKSVKEAVDLVGRVLGWMRNVADLNN